MSGNKPRPFLQAELEPDVKVRLYLTDVGELQDENALRSRMLQMLHTLFHSEIGKRRQDLKESIFEQQALERYCKDRLGEEFLRDFRIALPIYRRKHD